MRVKTRHQALGLALSLVVGITCTTPVWAASYELRIYTDDNPQDGEAELELLMSVAKPKPSHDGPHGRVTQTLMEYGYGLGHGWAVGLELPTAHTKGHHTLEGLKAEVQYVAAHHMTHGGYWGVRGDWGYTTTPYDTQGSNSMGINPILGYRWQTWHLAVNPSIELPLSGSNRKAQFQPSAKISKAITGSGQLGLEYFSSWGAVSAVLPQRQRDESIYLVWDQQGTNTTRWNLGLGKPRNPTGGSVDQWVVKAGIHFDLD